MAAFKSWQSYYDFARRARRERRFIRTAEDQAFLAEVLSTANQRVRKMRKGFSLCRAQVGHDWVPEYQDGTYIDDFPGPYKPERMKPLKGRAKEGRVNPKGIPCLYLSNKRETAMSEVRPWVGSLISLGFFKTRRSLKLVDCSVHHASGRKIYFKEPLAKGRADAVWTHIDRAFSEPVTEQDDVAEYVPTQIVAELFKSAGYDGIVYKSAFGEDGYNIALFDAADADLTFCALYKAKSVEWNFTEDSNPYWIQPDRKLVTQRIGLPAVGGPGTMLVQSAR